MAENEDFFMAVDSTRVARDRGIDEKKTTVWAFGPKARLGPKVQRYKRKTLVAYSGANRLPCHPGGGDPSNGATLKGSITWLPGETARRPQDRMGTAAATPTWS